MEQTTELPVWNGLTVDEQLGEFHYRDEDGRLQHLSFDTLEGALLYNAMKGTINLEMTVSPSGLTYMKPTPVNQE